MAFPTSSVKDDFNRANTTGLGANWTADPEGAGYTSFDVNTNQAKPNTAFSASYWSAASFAADQEVYATIAVLPVNACRILARIAGVGVLATEDNYELEVDANTSSWISKTVNGTRTVLSGNLGAFAAGDQMGLACIGNQIIAYKNGVEIGRVTDSSNTVGGYIAIVAQNDTTVRFDNFGGGNVVTFDAATVPLKLTPSGVDVYSGATVFLDALTARLTFTPSGLDVFALLFGATATAGAGQVILDWLGIEVPFIPPALPTPPGQNYTIPGGATVVTTQAALDTALAGSTAIDIKVMNGSYSRATPVTPAAGHRIWCESYDGVIFNYGWQWQYKSNWEMHGGVYNIPDDTHAGLDSITFAIGNWLGGPANASGGIVTDVTCDGAGVVGVGIRMAAPHLCQVRRVRVNNTISYGVYVSDNDTASTCKATRVEDIDCRGIYRRTTRGASDGQAEAGLWQGVPCTNVINRLFMNNIGWSGIWTGNNCNDTFFQNLTVNTVWGLLPADVSRVVGVGIYVEHKTRRCRIENFDISDVQTGINHEWNIGTPGNQASTDVMMRYGRINTNRASSDPNVGIFLGDGTLRPLIDGVIFLNTEHACIVDNTVDSSTTTRFNTSLILGVNSYAGRASGIELSYVHPNLGSPGTSDFTTTQGYNVYRNTSSSVPLSSPLNSGTPLNTATYTDTAVVGGTSYWYVVQSVNPYGVTAVSSTAGPATPTAAIIPPPIIVVPLPSPGPPKPKPVVTKWSLVHLNHAEFALGEVYPRNLDFAIYLNRVGYCNYDIDMRHPLGKKENTSPYETDFILMRGNEPIMGGEHTSVSVNDVETESIAVAGLDWGHWVERQIWPFDPNNPTANTYLQTGRDIALVVKDLLTQAIAFPDALDLDLTSIAAIGNLIDYKIEVNDTGDIYTKLTDLAKRVPGFDFEITWDKKVLLYYPQKGGNSGITLTQGDNIANVQYTNNGPTATITLGTARSASSQIGYLASIPAPQYRRSMATQDFGDITDSTQLQQQALGEGQRNATPHREISFEIDEEAIDVWEGIRVGDTVGINADIGYEVIDDDMRVVGMQCKATDEGDEQWTLTVDDGTLSL